MDLSAGPLELSDTGGTQTITGPTAELTISAGEGNIFQFDPVWPTTARAESGLLRRLFSAVPH